MQTNVNEVVHIEIDRCLCLNEPGAVSAELILLIPGFVSVRRARAALELQFPPSRAKGYDRRWLSPLQPPLQSGQMKPWKLVGRDGRKATWDYRGTTDNCIACNSHEIWILLPGAIWRSIHQMLKGAQTHEIAGIWNKCTTSGRSMPSVIRPHLFPGLTYSIVKLRPTRKAAPKLSQAFQGFPASSSGPGTTGELLLIIALGRGGRQAAAVHAPFGC